MDKLTIDGLIRRKQWRQDGAARCWALARQNVLGLSLALVCQSALAQAMYRITDLGSLGGGASEGVALNGSGQAVGNSSLPCPPSGCSVTYTAFLWSNDGTPMQELAFSPVSLVGGYWSLSTGINKSGLVTGVSDLPSGTQAHAFLSSSGGMPLLDLGTLGGAVSIGEAVNDLGEVAGTSYLANDPNQTTPHAFLWKNDGTPMHDLGTLGGRYIDIRSINNALQIVGDAAAVDGAERAVILNNYGALMQDIGTLGGSYGEADDINDSGMVTGFASLSGDAATHAFLWRNDGTPMLDLGTIAGTYSSGIGINSMGQVAGDSCWSARCNFDHAFLWKNDGTPMHDLGTLGGRESHAVAINNSGQVIGHSYIKGNTARHAFLWRNDGTKMQDLNALIDPTDPLKPYVTLFKGDAINDTSQILADGVDSRIGQTHAYLLQGTVLTLNPRSLAFGNQPIGKSSAVKAVTMTNTSPNVVAITVTLTGTAAGQFPQTNNCGKSLAGHAICTMKVTFKPTSKGVKSATLSVNGGGNGLRVVNLSGTGI